jgi:hypothetical protein
LTSLLHRLAVVQKASCNDGVVQGQRVLNVRIICRGGTMEIAWVGTVAGRSAVAGIRSAVAVVVHAGSTVAGQRGLGRSLGIGRRSLVFRRGGSVRTVIVVVVAFVAVMAVVAVVAIIVVMAVVAVVAVVVVAVIAVVAFVVVVAVIAVVAIVVVVAVIAVVVVVAVVAAVFIMAILAIAMVGIRIFIGVFVRSMVRRRSANGVRSTNSDSDGLYGWA